MTNHTLYTSEQLSTLFALASQIPPSAQESAMQLQNEAKRLAGLQQRLVIGSHVYKHGESLYPVLAPVDRPITKEFMAEVVGPSYELGLDESLVVHDLGGQAPVIVGNEVPPDSCTLSTRPLDVGAAWSFTLTNRRGKPTLMTAFADGVPWDFQQRGLPDAIQRALGVDTHFRIPGFNSVRDIWEQRKHRLPRRSASDVISQDEQTLALVIQEEA